VLVCVVRAAICCTDIFAAQGTLPVAGGRVLGHEFTGVVESAGSRFAIGQRVVLNPRLSCGRCGECLVKRPHQCAHARFLGIESDGAFAQLIAVSEARVFPLADGIGDRIGAYAEPLPATMAVLDASLPIHGRIVVKGRGRIAELTRLIPADQGLDAVTAVEGEFDGVVETDLCSANAEAIPRAKKPGGLLIFKSRVPEAFTLPPLLCITRRLRLRSVYYAEFARAMRYLENQAKRLDTFVGSEWMLEEYEQAFAAASEGEALKIYVKPND
jgi:L-iditol 2-dehydrogenase